MRATSLIAFGTILAVTGPALADQFFIVQDATAKTCSVVTQAPADGAGLLGDGAYGDRASAEADMKKIGACATQAAQSGAAPAASGSATGQSGAAPAETTATTPAR
jgi:hypothetical protein